MNQTNDLELVKSFQNGNETAFNRLVLKYQEKVYWIARKFVDDHDRADDITQEVFIKVYGSLKEFRFESAFFTWLYRIAVNISLNAIRKQKVREFFRIDELLNIEDSSDARPDKILERNEQNNLINEAVESLPERQKAVFILRYHEELPYEDISVILKTSIGGLKANYFHAVRKIGVYLNRAYRTH
jgi:RNA polymerase sigma-70 factor, ECF subfamily